MRTRALSIIVLLALAFGPVSETLADTTYGGGLRQLMAAGVIQANATTLNMGNGLTVAQNGSDPSRYDITSAGGGGGYATIQSGGAGVTARTIFNMASPSLTAADNAGATRTDISIATSPASAATVVGTGRLINTTAPVTGGGDHSADRTIALSFTSALNNNGGSLDVTAAAPATTIKSEATAAAAGSANSFVRTDAQLQAFTAAPTVNILSDASTAQQGSLSSLMRSDARLLATTAAPSVNVLTDASTFAQGTSTSLMRADARLIATTAAPSVNTLSDASTNAQGTATSFSRADHRHIATTAAPTTLDGTASNSQGTSTSLARADHIHAMPASIAVATTYSAAGTALAVTNNQTIGGTLLVTGAATLNGVQTYGSNSIPSRPTGTNLSFVNAAIAGNQVPYLQNVNRGWVGSGFCNWGAQYRFALYPSRGQAALAGTQIPRGLAIGSDQWVVSGATCTSPAPSGSTFQTRAARYSCTSGTSINNYGDIFTGSSNSAGVAVVTLADGFQWTTTVSLETNLTNQNALVGMGSVGGVNDPNVREGLFFCFRGADATTGNWFICNNSANTTTNFTRVDLGSNCQRSITRVMQFTLDAVPGSTTPGYEAWDVTTPSAPVLCGRGTIASNPPNQTTPLVLENYCQINTAGTACTHDIYTEEGCGGVVGVQ